MGWILILAICAALVILLVASLIVRDFRYYRGMARREFVEFIGRHCPDIVIEQVGPSAIVARVGQHVSTLRPQHLYLALSTIDLTDPQAKDEVFDRIAARMRNEPQVG